MATKRVIITPAVWGRSEAYNKMHLEIGRMLLLSGERKGAKHLRGIVLEVYCRTIKKGGTPYKKTLPEGMVVWDLDAIRKISEMVIFENNELFDEIHKDVVAAKRQRIKENRMPWNKNKKKPVKRKKGVKKNVAN